MSALLQRRSAAGTLERKAEIAVDRARRLGQPVLNTHTEPLVDNPDPLAFLAASSAAMGDGVLWMQPHTAETFAGAGTAIDIQAEGPGRFGTIASAIRVIQRTIVGRDPAQRFPLVGGFAFDPLSEARESVSWDDFPAGRFIVPRIVLQTAAGRSFVRVTDCVRPLDSALDAAARLQALFDQSQGWLRAHGETDELRPGALLSHRLIPDRSVWESAVATAVSLIRQGLLGKVVLAREVRLLACSPFAPLAALSRLRAADSRATVFAMQSGRSWFIGATPERLVRLTGRRVEVTCLAGSIGVGETEQERSALAAKLLASQKDREEHEIVVRSTLEALKELCEEVTRMPGSPRVAVARGVQHLESPLTARLSAEGQVLDLVERLHPTPAVGGAPRQASLNVIRELEAIERGWYAGPFGWTDLDGSGEFAVAIRSALISGRTASLFAGSGIVADSVPASEFDETELKLRPMLAALEAL